MRVIFIVFQVTMAQNKALQPVTGQPVTGRPVTVQVMPHGNINHASFVMAKTSSIGNSSSGSNTVMVSVILC